MGKIHCCERSADFSDFKAADAVMVINTEFPGFERPVPVISRAADFDVHMKQYVIFEGDPFLSFIEDQEVVAEILADAEAVVRADGNSPEYETQIFYYPAAPSTDESSGDQGDAKKEEK